MGNEDWEEFLDFLGEKIQLKGWKKYRAGLDVEADTTGQYSIHTVFNNSEGIFFNSYLQSFFFKKWKVMFHVSTLLPHRTNDKQQVWF